MRQIIRAQRVRFSLLVAISALFLLIFAGCGQAQGVEPIPSETVEIAIQTEVANQLASSTEDVIEEPAPTNTALPEPTLVSTDAPALEELVEIEPTWYVMNDSLGEIDAIGFARVKTIPAILYASPEDAVAKTNKKRTLPGDEVYVSYLSTEKVGRTMVYEVDSGSWMAADQLEEIQPSAFGGIQILGVPESDFGWVVEPGFSFLFSAEAPNQKQSGHFYRRYKFLLVDSVLVDEDGLNWYQIGENEWISDEHFSFVRLRTESPAQVYSRRWIDVDLTEQNLVVYTEGKPVFATLISTGLEQGWTAAGVFTIYNQTEVYDLYSPDPQVIGNYYLEDVPWILFYESSWAIHGAYWHDSFGLPNSHGCVNMSMTDAGWLYNWAQPSDYVFLFW